MANEQKPVATGDLDELAFAIFAARIAAHPSKRGGEAEAVDSYQKAEAFMAVRAKAQAGELKRPAQVAGSKLCDVFCPNLKKSHPHNLVSAKYGNLDKVNRIKLWLDKNPTPETDADELPPRLQREFNDLEWDLPTINTARAIFPAYCKV